MQRYVQPAINEIDKSELDKIESNPYYTGMVFGGFISAMTLIVLGLIFQYI